MSIRIDLQCGGRLSKTILVGLSLGVQTAYLRSGLWRAIDLPNTYEAPHWPWVSFPGAITYEYAQQAAQKSDHEHKNQDLVTHVVEVHTAPESLDPKHRLLGRFLNLEKVVSGSQIPIVRCLVGSKAQT